MYNLLKHKLQWIVLLIGFAFFIACKRDNVSISVETEVNYASTEAAFLFLSDVHLNSENTTDDTYYHEDTKMKLWLKAKEKISAVIDLNNPKFIIYTGDLPDHFPSHGSVHKQNIKTMLAELTEVANGIPLFYTPGNNDALNGDYYPFSECSQDNAFSLLPGSDFPAPNAKKVYHYNKEHGYYSAQVEKGLRVIAINSVLLGHTYHSNHCKRTDLSPVSQLIAGNAQMNWLEEQLAMADYLKEKVYLIMHIPPGLDAYNTNKNGRPYKMWAHDHWQNDFLTYVDSFRNSISAVLYGHTHMEEFRLLASPKGGYSEVALSCPGITPHSGNNPGFKIVNYNSEFEMIDFTTYYMGLPNDKWGNDAYTFTSIYSNSAPPNGTISNALINLDPKIRASQMQKYFRVKHKSGSSWSKLGMEVNYL